MTAGGKLRRDGERLKVVPVMAEWGVVGSGGETKEEDGRVRII